MAKAKTKTVKVRVAVIYNEKGEYQAGGFEQRRPLSVPKLIEDARNLGWPNDPDKLPHACIADIELPIPETPKGKVVKIKKVK